MMSFVSTTELSASAGAGLILGLAYFAALWRSVTLLVGRSRWLAPVALTLGRIGGAVLLLGVAARCGALDLPAALIGLTVARFLAVRVVRRAA